MSSEPALVERMAELASRLSYDETPDSVRRAAERNLVDTVGCAVAGVRTPVADAVRTTMTAAGGAPEATVLGTTTRLPAAAAAFVNATAAHALELDDTDAQSFCHPGAVVVPAVLAVAESRGRSGADAVEAMLIGYEVTLRLARWLNPAHRLRGFHTTATVPTIGAAAAVSRLLGGERRDIAQAIAVSCSFAGGTFAFLDSGANVKRVHAGKAAYQGVLAAMLAAGGVEGSPSALDGTYGLYATMADPQVVTYEPDDRAYLIEDVGLKPYPCCRFCHAAIDAALELHSGRGGDANIADVRITVSRLCLAQTGSREPGNELQRQFSTPYGVALALLYGKVSLADYVREDARAAELAARSRIEADPGLEPTSRHATVSLRRSDGSEATAAVPLPTGEPEVPIPPEQLAAKFYDLTDSELSDSRSAYRRLKRIADAPETATIVRQLLPESDT